MWKRFVMRPNSYRSRDLPLWPTDINEMCSLKLYTVRLILNFKIKLIRRF
jgi:hypothetical protein